MPEGLVLFPWTHGYFCYAYQERLPEVPDDVWACREWANANAKGPDDYGKAVYILFDQDGPVVEGLPSYDW